MKQITTPTFDYSSYQNRVTSPYARLQQPHLFPLIMLIMIVQPSNSHMALIFVALIYVTMIGYLVYELRNKDSRWHGLKLINALYRDLHWFARAPVTCHPLPKDGLFVETLRKHDYQTIDLDGNRVHSWQDLSDALQPHTAPLKFPSDYHAHSLALLQQMATEKPRRRAIIWHNADASIRSNPAFVSTLIGEWSSLAPQLPIGLLMFLDLPDPVATTEQTTAAVLRGQPGPDPDRANLKDAPDGAWWQPKPGELTQ